MRKTPITLLLLAAGLFPVPAWAADCEFLWRRFSDPIQPTAPARSVGIVEMRNRGTILCATGPLTYVRPPGLDSPVVEWLSPDNAPAAEIFSNEHGPAGPAGTVSRRPVPATIGISLKRGSRAGRTRVKLTSGRRGLAAVGTVGAPVSFEAVCSPSGILHGTSGGSDYLIDVDLGR